jgi:hypothetical protein
MMGSRTAAQRTENRMLYLIGVDHWNAQALRGSRPETDAHREYVDCLRYCIEHLKVVFIAEELNTEQLGMKNAVSLAQKLASELQIRHEFCDPNGEERIRIGYPEYDTVVWWV